MLSSKTFTPRFLLNVGPDTSLLAPKMALRYQRAEMDYLAAVAGNVSSMIEASTRKP